MGDGLISRRGLGGGGGSGDLSNYYNKTETDDLLSGKVDKVAGKQLSDENYTAVEKAKLANISVIPNYTTGSWTPTFGYYLEGIVNQWFSVNTSYFRQNGIYVLIGDLCYVNFSVKGYITEGYDHVMGVGGFPFYSSSDTFYQTLSLGVCVRYSSSDNSQLWTPPAAAVLRLESGSKHARIGHSNGYIDTWWPSDRLDTNYYIEGSGVYKIRSSNLSESPIDTTGSSVSPT